MGEQGFNSRRTGEKQILSQRDRMPGDKRDPERCTERGDKMFCGVKDRDRRLGWAPRWIKGRVDERPWNILCEDARLTPVFSVYRGKKGGMQKRGRRSWRYEARSRLDIQWIKNRGWKRMEEMKRGETMGWETDRGIEGSWTGGKGFTVEGQEEEWGKERNERTTHPLPRAEKYGKTF